MKTAAMVLGLVGGIIGVIIGLATYSKYGSYIIDPGILMLPLGAGACGIVGGALAKTHRYVSWVLMAAGGLVGFLFSPYLWIVPGISLFAGAGLRMAVKDEPSEGTA